MFQLYLIIRFTKIIAFSNKAEKRSANWEILEPEIHVAHRQNQPNRSTRGAVLAPSFCSSSSQESAFCRGERCRLADVHCPTGAFTLHLKVDSRSKSRFLVSTSCHTVRFLPSSQLADSRVSSRRNGARIHSDCRIRKERRRSRRRKRERRGREGWRKRRDSCSAISKGGYDPCRLFVIVICITMDETWIMGSWDLRSEHDEKGGKKEPSPFGTL